MTPEEFFDSCIYLSDDILADKTTILRAIRQYAQDIAIEAFALGEKAADFQYNSHLNIREKAPNIINFLRENNI